ncbi:hypothetical protein OPT61_g10259 [Boeremia exigua]|uniref:Uncharacterized protein n=1 Tax=Boeremia exigua TaxID=749465 RepID=A0ACC2HQH5_9PLEO|nr:hypothetical protein OPT61_g10259 [Boeremia exigua]
MSSTTDPTVPLPTATDTDDDDDDDDDVISSLLPSQPPAATPPPQPTVAAPPPADTAVPGVSSVPPLSTTPATSTPPSSTTGLADSLPSGSSTTDPPNNSNGGSNGFSAGASAGIGIGVALIVCLAAFGMWFFLRRRKARTRRRSASSNSSDEEHAPKAQKSDVYAFRAGQPAEVSGDEKPRRWSELESPTYVAEAGDGQVFRAELPGSVVPVATAGKGGDERLFADAPIDEVDEPIDSQERTVDKKRDERLFSDPPIDEGTDTLLADPTPRPSEKKG